jgi:hypothetical protein
MADLKTTYVRRALEIIAVPSNRGLGSLEPGTTTNELDLGSQDVASIALSLQNLAAAQNASAKIGPSDVSKAKTVGGMVKLALVTAKLADKSISDVDIAALIAAAKNLGPRAAGPMLSYPPKASKRRPAS